MTKASLAAGSLLATLVLLLSVTGCSERLPLPPTAPALAPAPAPGPAPPPAPTSGLGFIVGWVYEADKSRVCIVPAHIEIVAGASFGTVIQQTSYGCEEWFGFEIYELPLGAVVTLRVTAPGFVTQNHDITVTKGNDAKVEFHLRRAS